MKRTILATCLASACAIALSAQTPTQQPPPTAGTTGATTSQDTSQRSRGGPMTISGCLKAGDTKDTFVLTNVKGMGRPGGAAGTTGDTTAAPGATAGGATTSPEGGTRGANQVTLTTTASDVDFSKHLNHQIEVTGTPGRGAGTTAGGTTTGGTTGGDTAAGATGGATSTTGQTGRGPRSLNVTSVKMISETCSQ
jgi:hypothetical protein